MEEEEFETQNDAPSQRYDVVITGMRSGVERGEFLTNLSANLKTSIATLEPLFLPTGLTVKRNSDYATASKYVSVLREWNCVCKMVRSDAPPAPAKLPFPVKAPAAADPAALPPRNAYKPGWIVFALIAAFAVSYFRVYELRVRFGGNANVATGTSAISRDAVPAPDTPAASGAQASGAFELEIVRSKGFARDSMTEVVTAATALDEGGFIAATATEPSSTFLYKIANNGDVVWRQDLSSSHVHITAVGTGTDERYWIAGQMPDATGTSRDFTQRVGLDGKLAAPVILSSVSDNRLLHCVTATQAGFVQISSADALDEYFRLAVPAVSMTNENGDRVWEHLVPLDQGTRLETNRAGPLSTSVFTCAGITSDRNGRIIAAQRIVEVPDGGSADDLRKRIDASGIYGTLLVALDPQGKELGRVRHDNVAGATLVGTPGGAVLFETPYLHKGLLENTPTGLLDAVKVDARLHMYTFDFSLKEIRSAIVFAGTQLDSVDAVLLAPEGGLLITGCPGEGGSRYLLYIDSSGAMSPKRQFEQLGGNCKGLYQLSKGDNPGEALLLSQTPDGNRLFGIKYLN